MKLLNLPTIGILACTASISLSGQNVQNFIAYEVQQFWDVNDNVELDAGDHTLDTNTTNPGLFVSNFGPISGNTIDRTSFKTSVSNAYLNGTGGVIDFEDTNRSFSGGDYDPPGAPTSITRANAANQMIATRGSSNLITISRGPNWYAEGDAVTPYKGKQTFDFDGTGPSGPDRSLADVANTFFFESVGSGSRAELSPAGDGAGKALGNTTSYDLDFNISDQIGIVGFSIIQWNNFQSQQDATEAYANYPNIHAIATFSDGSTTETQMAVGLTQGLTGDSTAFDYYFGFEGSEGFYLEGLDVYFIGNNARLFAGIDDFGFVQVPEPSNFTLIAALLAGLGVLVRRRR